MSQLPLVSIIIPCYNAEAMIERCLSSCFQQVYPNIEIIVVDNNSTDGTIEIVRQFTNSAPQRLFLLHCAQQGANYARNFGFTQAKGDYIQWLDADDELTVNKIAIQIQALEKNRTYDIAYGDWNWCFWQNGQCRMALKFKSQQYEDYLLQLLVDNWVPPHTYLLRRKAATRLHELQAWHVQRNMDREYFTLAALLSYRFLYVPGAIASYNSWSSNQITQSTSYVNRVHDLKIIFQRFQHEASVQPENWMREQHRFLLNQNWDVWSLKSVSVIRHEQCFFLENRSTQAVRPASFSEAMTVRAMLQLPGARALEDHARGVVRCFWKAILQRLGSANASAMQQLVKLVGLSAEAAIDPDLQPLDFPELVITPSSQAISTNQTDLIDVIPLYAPLFGVQRLAILKILDTLRLEGYLNKIEDC